MKYRVFAAVLTAILVLSGCGAMASESRAAAIESTAAPSRITPEEAQAIALERAGFTADQVSRLRTEFEIDDGVPRYEVQFRQGRWEYDYEIHAETGAILSYDRDD